jgi:hypothetical protein
MPQIKTLLTRMEQNKGKIMKFFIVCAIINFFTSVSYSAYYETHEGAALVTTVNFYSLLILCLIAIHEFLPCILPKIIERNFSIITHYPGKGLLLMLISVFYVSGVFSRQQNYSAFLLFFIGIILIFGEFEFKLRSSKTLYEQAMELSKSKGESSSRIERGENERIYEETSPNNVPIVNEKKINPYDIPDDF